MCSTVPFGRCMCGRAAAERAVQFADRVDDRHDTRYEGMPRMALLRAYPVRRSHPGVVNLYVKEGTHAVRARRIS